MTDAVEKSSAVIGFAIEEAVGLAPGWASPPWPGCGQLYTAYPQANHGLRTPLPVALVEAKNKLVPGIPFPKLVHQCLSLLCAVAGDGCHAGRNRHLVVGNGLTRNGLPLYQHVADAILSKSICPDGEHHFGAVYDLFYQVVPGAVVWQDNKVTVYDIGQRHHLLHKIAHRSLPLLSDVGFF